MTVYDLANRGLTRESPKVEINSHQDLQKNTDGSVDVFFRPKAPAGEKPNWDYIGTGLEAAGLLFLLP